MVNYHYLFGPRSDRGWVHNLWMGKNKLKIAMGQDLPSFEPDNVQLKFGEISLENDTFDKNISLILGIKGSAV